MEVIEDSQVLMKNVSFMPSFSLRLMNRNLESAQLLHAANLLIKDGNKTLDPNNPVFNFKELSRYISF
jgi:hypothetical protein